MILSELRASAWKYASGVLAVLAVAAILYCLFLRAHSAADRLRADAAESRAQALQGQLDTAKRAIRGEQISADATKAARQSADMRQAERETRAARVESYAKTAADPSVADPRILRELAAGEANFRAATDRLRGYGHASGQGARPAE